MTEIIKETNQLQTFITEFLTAKKAVDINIIKVNLNNPLIESFIFANGRSKKHIESTIKLLALELKKQFNYQAKIEGIGDVRGWVLLDAGIIVVHLFLPEARDYYGLEQLWQKKLKTS